MAANLPPNRFHVVLNIDVVVQAGVDWKGCIDKNHNKNSLSTESQVV